MNLPQLVLEGSLGRIATSDSKGNPSVATVFYAVSEGSIFFLTHAGSLKVEQIKSNPKVCFLVSDDVKYRQSQIYGNAKIIDQPQKYIKLVEDVMRLYSENTDAVIPYLDIKTQGNVPVVIEIVPDKGRHFKSGVGLVE